MGNSRQWTDKPHGGYDALDDTSCSNAVLAKGRKGRRLFGAAALAAALICMLLLSGCMTQGNGAPALSQSELQPPDIAESGKLRVGVNANNSPMAGNSGGKLIGIDVDIAAALASELGLTLELVDVGSDPDTALDDDEVDVVLGIDDESDYEDYWVSKEYMQTGVVLFKNAKSNAEVPAADSTPTIAAQVSSKSAWAVTNTFGDDSLDAVTDLTSAFEDLGKGTVEFVASDAVIGLYAANRQGVQAEICALLESPVGYHAMVAYANDDLQDAVEDALSTLKDNGTIDIIEKKWLGQVVDLKGVPKIDSTRSSGSATSQDEEADDAGSEDGTDSDEDTDLSDAAAVVLDDDEMADDEEDTP